MLLAAAEMPRGFCSAGRGSRSASEEAHRPVRPKGPPACAAGSPLLLGRGVRIMRRRCAALSTRARRTGAHPSCNCLWSSSASSVGNHCNALTDLPIRIYMASRVRQSTRDLARYVTRAVYESADGQPRRWRTLSTIPGATAASVLYAVDQGWIELEGAHSARQGALPPWPTARPAIHRLLWLDYGVVPVGQEPQF